MTALVNDEEGRAFLDIAFGPSNGGNRLITYRMPKGSQSNWKHGQ
jgi:hypothetical protein